MQVQAVGMWHLLKWSPAIFKLPETESELLNSLFPI